MANESVQQFETRNPNLDKVMALRLLARLREIWPEEAALKEQHKLTLIQGGQGRTS